MAVATLGFAFPRATSRRKACRQAELRLPRDVTDHLRQCFLSIRMLPADPRHSLIGPGRFGEQPPHVGLPAFVIAPRRTLGPLKYSDGTRPR